MKKALLVTLALVMALTMVMGLVSTVSAAGKQPNGVADITGVTDGFDYIYVDFTYGLTSGSGTVHVVLINTTRNLTLLDTYYNNVTGTVSTDQGDYSGPIGDHYSLTVTPARSTTKGYSDLTKFAATDTY